MYCIQTNPYRLVRNKANIAPVGFSITQVILFLWEFEQIDKGECLTEISYYHILKRKTKD